MPNSPYKRVLLKISGETLMGTKEFGVSPEAVHAVADQLLAVRSAGFEVAVVLGGGNIFRGIQQGASWGLERTPADQVGMLATLINGVSLKSVLEQKRAAVSLFTALPCPTVAETYQWDRAHAALQAGRILLFVGGTGHPYFTTDTCAALRACELNVDILVKATSHVDGIYDRDPRKDPQNAVRYTTVAYSTLLEKQLGILDLTAVTLCMQAHIPIRVCNFYQGSLVEAFAPHARGTLVHDQRN